MRKRQPYPLILSSILMMMTMLWLTVSAPFVFAADKIVQTEIEQQSAESDETNPLSGTTEEKTESGTNSLSEYLSVHAQESMPFVLLSRSFVCHSTDTYFAFHPELNVPPPKA